MLAFISSASSSLDFWHKVLEDIAGNDGWRGVEGFDLNGTMPCCPVLKMISIVLLKHPLMKVGVAFETGTRTCDSADAFAPRVCLVAVFKNLGNRSFGMLSKWVDAIDDWGKEKAGCG